MPQAKASRGIEGAVENLIDIAHMQRESMDAGFAKLTAAQTELTQTVNSLGQTVENLGVKIDRLADKIDTLAMVTQAQQVTAQSQTENIAALIAHSNQLLAKIGA